MKKYDFQDLLYHFYAVFIAGVTLWIYMKTLAPTVSFFDSGELISAAYTFGVAHPPGYPLYVLLGWCFSKLPIGAGAYRINFMSAAFATLAVLMTYYIIGSILRQTRQRRLAPAVSPSAATTPPEPERMLSPVIAMAAALTFAFSGTHWKQATIAEVYPLNVFLCSVILWLLVQWHFANTGISPFNEGQTRWAAPIRRPRLLYFVALIFGLGFGNHQTIALLFLGGAFLVVWTTPRILLQFRTLLRIVLFLGLGLSIYLLIPLRAAQNPPINWGNAVNWRQFKWLVTREGYRDVVHGHALQTLWRDLWRRGAAAPAAAQPLKNPPPTPPGRGGLLRSAENDLTPGPPLPRSLPDWGGMGRGERGDSLPFGEGWGGVNTTTLPRKLNNPAPGRGEMPVEPPAVSPEPLKTPVPGLGGVYQTVRDSLLLKQLASFNPLAEFRILGVILALVGCGYGLIGQRPLNAAMLIALLCFVVAPVLIGDPPEENIFLNEEFQTPSYLLVAIWIGFGVTAIARAALWVAAYNRTLQYGLVFVLAVFFLILPGNQMVVNLKSVDRHQNYVESDYALNILDSLKPNAILFTWGDSGAFPLWYMQLVEHRRPDVTLLHIPHLSTDWYIATLPPDLFISPDPFHKYAGDIFPIIDEVVQKHWFSRPMYFDYSSTHSLTLPYEMIPHGIVYKVAVPGDTLDEEVWPRYRLRGILDNTRIALDSDIKRAFLMYGSARIELGNYYLDRNQLEKAAQEFNAAVQLDPSLGDHIVRMLQFRDKMAGGAPEAMPNITLMRQAPPN